MTHEGRNNIHGGIEKWIILHDLISLESADLFCLYDLFPNQTQQESIKLCISSKN